MSIFFTGILRRSLAFFLSIPLIHLLFLIEGPKLSEAGDTLRVVVDPGHGGRDLGVKGLKGTNEKDVTLTIALKLAKKIDRNPDLKAFLTRKDDRFTSLSERVEFVSRARGDIFLSLHTNGSFNERASGARIFYMSFDFKREEEKTGSSKGTDNEVKAILSDMARTEVLNESGVLAKTIYKNLRPVLGRKGKGIFQTLPKLLIYLEIPAILVEVGFLTNSEDFSKLTHPRTQGKIIEGLYQGIDQYHRLKRRSE